MISEWPERAVLVVAEDDGEWHSRWPGEKWLLVSETARGGTKEDEYNAWRVDVGMLLASFTGRPASGGWFEVGDKTTHFYSMGDIPDNGTRPRTGLVDRDAVSEVYTLWDLDPKWLILHLMAHVRAAWGAQSDIIRELEDLVQRRGRVPWPKTPRPAPAQGA